MSIVFDNFSGLQKVSTRLEMYRGFSLGRIAVVILFLALLATPSQRYLKV